MHHNNFGNFYTREIYAVPIPIGFIPIPIPIMSHMAIPIPMGMEFPWGFPLPCTPLVGGNWHNRPRKCSTVSVSPNYHIHT